MIPMVRSLFLFATAAAFAQQPGTRPLEYQPGAYFPPGFPLNGVIRVLSSPTVEMGQRVQIKVEYLVGANAIEAGSAIEVWKHFTSDVEGFQIANASAPAYFSVTLPNGVTGKPLVWDNWSQRNTPPVFPYRKCAGILIEQGTLKPGARIIFNLGGPQGVRMQHYEENLFNFRFALTKNGSPTGYAGDAVLKVTGGPMRKLKVQAPSVVKLAEPFSVEIVPLDEWVSLARNHTGLSFRLRSGNVAGASFAYDPNLLHYIARSVTASQLGVLRIEVETADGQYRGTSNPIWVETDPLRRPYYGELHQHTYLADGRGVFEELYLYGRRVGLLDFGSVTPHHSPMSVTGPMLLMGKNYPRENWPELQQVTKRMNGWQDFVSVLGYEYSVGTSVGGHHNVFFNADQARTSMQLDPSQPNAPVGKMLETIKFARVPTLVIPHIGGAPPDWSHPTDPRIERQFEIASVHGVFEESWQKHLSHGLRLGVIAAGDTHTTSMGIAYPGLIYVNMNGLAGVWAHRKDRAAIWDGLYERRSFATTGNTRMVADFLVNGEPMGGEISSRMSGEARIEARLSGTEALVRVELVKNNQVIHAIHPARKAAGTLLRVVFGDNFYQRRAAVGLRSGDLRPAGGRLRMRQTINIDQAFESVYQRENDIIWTTAAVSGDRDGFLVDIGEVSGDSLLFRHDDSDALGLFEVRIPLDQLRQDGKFSHSWRSNQPHPYMEKMGVEPRFFLECDLIDLSAPKDERFTFLHREAVKPGDYFYLRAEQLDTNKLWTSPVWVN